MFLKALRNRISELLGNKPKFVHLVGHFDQTDIRVNGQQAKPESIVAAKGNLSEYMTVKAGRTTYVLWNGPDQAQRDIQLYDSKGERRNNTHDMGNTNGQVLDLSDDKIALRAKTGFAAAVTPALPLVSDEFRAAAAAFTEKFSQARLARHPASPTPANA